jgi:hypothetical protein
LEALSLSGPLQGYTPRRELSFLPLAKTSTKTDIKDIPPLCVSAIGDWPVNCPITQEKNTVKQSPNLSKWLIGLVELVGIELLSGVDTT